MVTIRSARTADARAISDLVRPFAERRVLVAKELVAYFEDIQEFVVALDDNGRLIGCGALHVIWEDLAEVRTLAVDPAMRGRGLGHTILGSLLDRAQHVGVSRVFCLTFEREFFIGHGFEEIPGPAVLPEVFVELLRSMDDGVAQFLDLARAKPNTLGNSRMLKFL